MKQSERQHLQTAALPGFCLMPLARTGWVSLTLCRCRKCSVRASLRSGATATPPSRSPRAPRQRSATRAQPRCSDLRASRSPSGGRTSAASAAAGSERPAVRATAASARPSTRAINPVNAKAVACSRALSATAFGSRPGSALRRPRHCRAADKASAGVCLLGEPRKRIAIDTVIDGAAGTRPEQAVDHQHDQDADHRLRAARDRLGKRHARIQRRVPGDDHRGDGEHEPGVAVTAVADHIDRHRHHRRERADQGPAVLDRERQEHEHQQRPDQGAEHPREPLVQRCAEVRCLQEQRQRSARGRGPAVAARARYPRRRRHRVWSSARRALPDTSRDALQGPFNCRI